MGGSDICVPWLQVTTEVEHKIAAYKYQRVIHEEDDVFIAFKKQVTKSSKRGLFFVFFLLKGKVRLNTKQILLTRKFFTVLNSVPRD